MPQQLTREAKFTSSSLFYVAQYKWQLKPEKVQAHQVNATRLPTCSGHKVSKSLIRLMYSFFSLRTNFLKHKSELRGFCGFLSSPKQVAPPPTTSSVGDFSLMPVQNHGASFSIFRRSKYFIQEGSTKVFTSCFK